MKKCVCFLLKKTSQPRKKLKFCMKNDKKRNQKEHPVPQKLKFCMKKRVFLLKKTSQPLKKLKFCMKNDKKMTKKGTKKSTQPRKN